MPIIYLCRVRIQASRVPVRLEHRSFEYFSYLNRQIALYKTFYCTMYIRRSTHGYNTTNALQRVIARYNMGRIIHTHTPLCHKLCRHRRTLQVYIYIHTTRL